jgi:GTP cyclohydrolase FolE2
MRTLNNVNNFIQSKVFTVHLVVNNVNNFIQSKVFTVHLVVNNLESVHQHVAYITDHDEAWVLV